MEPQKKNHEYRHNVETCVSVASKLFLQYQHRCNKMVYGLVFELVIGNDKYPESIMKERKNILQLKIEN